MLLFIPRSLCALKRVAAKEGHARFQATQGIRIALASGVYRAEATDGRRAMVVQGLIPGEDPPWPGFKDLPDDACEAVIMPRDLERACKVGKDFLQSRLMGIATMGNDVCLGLGSELVTARTVEGRFPNINQVIPKEKPLFTFSFDPKTLTETLLAMAELLPETDRRVELFYYGNGLPIGFCARNIDNGIFIDALVVPLTLPKADEKPAEEEEPEEPAQKSEQPNQPESETSPAPQEEPAAPPTPPVSPSGTARARRGVRRAQEAAEKGGTPS